MPYIAPKIFPNQPPAAQRELLALLAPTDGLETTVYSYRPLCPSAVDIIRAIPTHQKMHHLWSKNCWINDFNEQPVRKAFHYELEQCCEMQVNKAVIHMHPQNQKKQLNAKDIASAVASAAEYALKHGLKLYLENIYEPLSFFRELYEELTRVNVADTMGFCLDTGHARCYSYSKLTEWSSFIKDISTSGFKIHYHIHANDSTSDMHLTLAEAEKRGFLGKSPEWAPNGFMEWLKQELINSPNAIFCLEHPAEKAKEALEHIRAWQASLAI